MSSNPPPPILFDARVLAYIEIDDSMEFTGKLRLYAGEERVGRLPRLAICEILDEEPPELIVCHCDEHWNVVGVQGWNGPGATPPQSIEEVKKIVEKYYTGSTGAWRTLP